MSSSTFFIYKAGFAIRLFAPRCGFLISWDGDSNVMISVPTYHSSGLDGICGNCNQDRDDDPTEQDVFSKYSMTNYSQDRYIYCFVTKWKLQYI